MKIHLKTKKIVESCLNDFKKMELLSDELRFSKSFTKSDCTLLHFEK